MYYYFSMGVLTETSVIPDFFSIQIYPKEEKKRLVKYLENKEKHAVKVKKHN